MKLITIRSVTLSRRKNSAIRKEQEKFMKHPHRSDTQRFYQKDENTIEFNPQRQRKSISLIPKSINQENYILALLNEDIDVVIGTGPAGTGKTYFAEQLGKLLGWAVITLNCNQYTSPLDILGGQTTEGYQEGKLIMAWSNRIVRPDKTSYPVTGAILLLDELPKIDPNTAGILNDALAKVKSFSKDVNGNITKPTIMNGRNEVFELENMYVIATGNVALNTIDPDYEANFKQDLSLQDRFIGSTYEIFVDYETEFNIMEGFAFIWLYLVKVREKIKELRATGQAFVSMRLMINTRETYKVYREIADAAKALAKGKVSGDAVTQPKTIIQTMDNFFGLFKPTQRDTIKRETNYDEWKRVVEAKNKYPYDSAKPNFDDPGELTEVRRLIEKNKAEIAKMYS